MTLHIIIADKVFDQVCESHADAAREAAELRDAGHRVKLIRCDSWDEVYAIEDRMNH